MDGIHDMGGMQGFGRVPVEPNELVFHVAAGIANLDAFRHAIERLDPVSYLTAGYYGRMRRLFGLTFVLEAKGLFSWDEFRARLIAEIAQWERCPSGEWSYYARWLAALEALLASEGLCLPAELDARERTLAARPLGHDH